MNVDISNITPAAIYIGAMVVLLTTLRLAIDFSEIKKSQAVKRKLIRLAASLARRPISVVVELRRSADHVIPLLDQMKSVDYAGLEVVVVIRPSAGRLAEAKLRQYRKESGFGNIKLTRLKRSLPLSAIALRKTSGQIIIVLPASARLGHRFFDAVAIQGLVSEGRPFRLNSVLLAGNDLAGGISAHFSVWQNWLRRLRPERLSGLQTGLVYARSFLVERRHKNQYKAVAASEASIGLASVAGGKYPSVQKQGLSKRLSWRLTYLFSVVAVASMALSTLETTEERWTLVLGAFATYLVAFGMVIARLRLYSRQDRLSLLLLSPFAVLAAGLKVMLDLFKYHAQIFVRRLPIRARR